MEKDKQFFSPKQIDEQIEQRIDGLQATFETRFLSEMQQIAQQIRAEQELSLQRVEDRLMKHSLTRAEYTAAAPSDQRQRSPSPRLIQQERSNRMEKMQASKFGRRVSMLIAVLITAVLVGSLVTVLSFVHQKATMTGHGQIATPPSTSGGSFGKTLYTTSNQSGFNELAWSPDSNRVAAFTNKLQIWDATTGKHVVSASIPTDTTTEVTLAWSPDSQLIAVGTNQSLLVVNSQNGAIVSSYSYSAASASVNTPSGVSLLSAHMSGSDGAGFGVPAWSPDGKLIAVTVFGTSLSGKNKILVWNPQTNTVAFEITGSGSTQDTRVAAWSPDGQYLAGTSSGPVVPPNYVVVWKVSTRQIVFKDRLASNAEPQWLTWQPHSNNLAFGQLNTFEIWNVLDGKQLKHYSLEIGSALAWSPDGKYLAYVSYGSVSWVNIIDASSGQQVYTYKGHAQSSNVEHYISTLAWSPNGKYIVSGEGQTPGSRTTIPVLKVWTAE